MNYLKFFAGLAFIAGSLSFSACSSNDDEPKVKPEPVEPTEPTNYCIALNLTGTDFGLGDDNTLARTFSAGDKAGLFLIKDGQAVVDNLEISYDGENWIGYTELTDKDGRFMVYYPYSEAAASKVDLSADNAADFFATYLSSVGAPAADQTNLDAVMHSDVLFGQAVASKSDNVKVENLLLDVAVNHSLAATSFVLPGATTYTTSDGFAYSTPGGSTLAAVKIGNSAITPATVNGRPTVFYRAGSASDLTVDYKFQGADKSATVALGGTAGTLNTVNVDGGSSDGGKRDLQIGDLYYRDGSIYPVEQLADIDHAPNGVAGVIFCVDPDRFSAEETALLGKVHALVISAKMARTNKKATYMAWCDAYPQPGEDGDGRYIDSNEDPAFPGLFLPLIEDRTSYTVSYDVNNSDLRGYWYTSVIRTRRADEISKGYYLPFEALNNLAASVPVSATSTTGWYLPSVGQMLDVMRNLGGAHLTVDNAQKFMAGEECDFNFTPESTADLTAKLDKSITKINFLERDAYTTADYAIWTSSYAKAYSPYTYSYMPAIRQVVFDSDVLSVLSYDIIGKGNVRGVLAF